ncbi:MAG: T9SS type A sorting domain-containing protein [Bacteroidetes bacterium]|nr:T9SS type A sorting domain-containing protein [Bacteroidota bacterium]
MKKVLLISTAVFFCLTFARGQTPNWQWAKSPSGSFDQYMLYSVAADANGNSYLVGSFQSDSVTFGSITLANANTGSADIFLAKYDASGNVLWAKRAGGIGNDAGFSVTNDTSGNVYITGYFASTSITFGSTTLPNSGIFIVKYDASGNVIWAKCRDGGSLAYSGGNSIVINGNGDVYVTGGFSASTLTFGSTTLINAGLTNIFIVKYDTLGNVLWAKSAGGMDTDEGLSIATDANSNAYVTGYFYSSSFTFGSTTLTNVYYGQTDIFIVKYDSSGNVIWAKSAGGTQGDRGNGIATDASGDVYATGIVISDSITFDSITLYNSGVFVVKYDPSGNVLWAEGYAGLAGGSGTSIATDASSNVYVAGAFGSDSIVFGSTTLTNADPFTTVDIFIAKFDALGNALWAKSAGGSSNDGATSVTSDVNGNVFVAGLFQSPTLTFGSTTLTSSGGWEIFLAKLGLVTGVNEWSNKESFSVYPNPFSFTTTLQVDKFLKSATLTVYNSLGQTVKQIKNISGQTVTFSRDNLASGLYFVRLTEENKTIAVDKLVIADK